MGIANDYYRILEEESQGFYQDTEYAKEKALKTKFLRGSIKTLSNFGINPTLAAIGTSLGSLIGGKHVAESHIFEKMLKDHSHIGSMIDAAALTPYMMMRMGNLAENLKNHKTEQNYFVHGNNWQDYGVKTQSAHVLRTLSKLVNTTSILGMGAGIALGQPELAAAATRFSPYLLSFNLGQNLAHLTGSAVGGGAHLAGNLLTQFGHAGAGTAIGHVGDLLSGLLGGPIGGILGGTLASTALTKLTKSLTPKTASIISVAPLNEPGLPQLMMTSTYKTYANTIRLLQGQGLLKPSESLMLSILNDINLNTHALVPIYGKFLSNSKEVSQQHHINTWSALLNDETSSSKAAKFGLNESDFSLRRAMFKTLTSAELYAESLLYKIPGARFFTGMSKEEFEEKKRDLLFNNDNRARAEEVAFKKTGISISTIRILNTKADKWLNAPDYESRMLGLTAGIYELVRFIARHTDSAKNVLSIYNKTLDYLYEKDLKIYPFEEEKSLWERFKHAINPINHINDIFITPIKSLFNLKSKFKQHLGIATVDDIYKTYENNKKFLKNKFDVKKSAEMYLGKYLPDHMTQIIHYLKTISINIKDMLKCWDCNITDVKNSFDKWRGRYGKYMDEESFEKRIKADAYRLTRNQLGIRVRSEPTGVSKLAAKIMGINKETLNEDNSFLKSLFREDFFKSKKITTADDEQKKLKKEKEIKETENAIKKTPEILENMFTWFKKHSINEPIIENEKNKDSNDFSLFGFFNLPKWFKKLPKGIKNLLTGITKLGKKILLPLIAIGADILKQLPITSKIIEGLSKAYKGFMNKLKTGLTKAKDFIIEKWTDLKEETKTIWDKTKSKVSNLWNTITSSFKNMQHWTIDKFHEATSFVKKKISSVWENTNETVKKVLGKFKSEAEKMTKWASKFIPTKNDVKILISIIKNKLPKWLIKKEGERVAARFMTSVGATLAGAAAGGLPGILMTLVDLVIWGDLVWDVYKFIKNEYFKETGKNEKQSIFKFKSNKITFEDGSEFIDTVKEDPHASALFEHHWFTKNKVNFSTSNLYKFLRKGGDIQELQNIYNNAKKFDRFENNPEVAKKRINALINLSKSGKLKNIRDEKQLEHLINEEIVKEQNQAHLQGKIQADILSQQNSNNHSGSKDLKQVVKHLQENVAVSAQGSSVIAQLLTNLINTMNAMLQIENDSNQTLKQISIPDLSRN